MEIQFDGKTRLGVGGYGSVFPGTFLESQVAVKRVLLIRHHRWKRRKYFKTIKHCQTLALFQQRNFQIANTIS